jgi:hypothetical protein
MISFMFGRQSEIDARARAGVWMVCKSYDFLESNTRPVSWPELLVVKVSSRFGRTFVHPENYGYVADEESGC